MKWFDGQYVLEVIRLIGQMVCCPLSVFEKIIAGQLTREAIGVFCCASSLAWLKAVWWATTHARPTLTFFETDELNRLMQGLGHPLIILLVLYLVYGGFVLLALKVGKTSWRENRGQRFIVGLFAISAIACLAQGVLGILGWLEATTFFILLRMLTYLWVAALTIAALRKCLGLPWGVSLTTFLLPFSVLFMASLHFGLAPYMVWIGR